MTPTSTHSSFLPLALGLLLLVWACGGGGSESVPGPAPASPPQIDAFSATPGTIATGGSSRLSFIFHGGTGVIDHGVGTVISGTDVGVSPASTTTYTLSATNSSGTTTAAATVTVTATPPVITVSVNPSSVSLRTGSSQIFAATVSGSATTAVNWSVTEAGGGNITSEGLYTAPAIAGIYHVLATSRADATTSASATVAVNPASTVTSVKVSPSMVTLDLGATQPFTATVNGAGSPSQAVVWAASAGSINTGGLFTAPSLAGDFTVTALSVQDGTASDRARVTVVPPPVASSLTANPTTITAGASARLIPVFSGGTGVITPGNVSCTNGQAVSVSPIATTPYALTVTNPAGTSATARTTVQVVPVPVITGFSAAQSSIPVGTSTTLTAVFSGGTGSLDNGLGAMLPGVPISTGNLIATKIINLTVTGPTGLTARAQLAVEVDADPRLYPVGDQMPLGLYDSDEGFEGLPAAGWNLFQTYSDPQRLALALEARNAGVGILGSLPGKSLPGSDSLASDQVQAYRDLAGTGAVTWWDLPEERDWSKPDEMRIIQKYAELIRGVPQPLPTYMYIPSDYDAQEISKYLPFIDIVPAAVYPCYANQPYAWSRWRMETTVSGIIDAKAVIGKDYRAGQKSPVAILELFYDPLEKGHLLSAEGAYHDFWQVLVSGAQGILIYSYFHRNDDSSCLAAWGSLQRAMGELLGSERLDQVLLWGAPVSGIHASVTEGPTTTRPFTPIKDKPGTIVSYDSVDLTARQVGRTLYVVVVNSAEGKVNVNVFGLSNATQAEVLFRGQRLPISNGIVYLENIEALGVRILKVQLD